MWSWRSSGEALPKLVAKGCSGQGQQLLGITLEYYFHVKCVCANTVHLLILNNATGKLSHLPPRKF